MRPWGKARVWRETILESKAYSNIKNSCLPSPHFARLCWQVVTSWHGPVVLGYLVSLLAPPPPHGDTFLFCSASCHPMETCPICCVPPCPWPLLFSFVHFTPPTPWLSALGGRQHTLPHTLMPGWGCSSSACLSKLVQNSWRQMLDLTHYHPQRLAHNLCHKVYNKYQIYNI